MKKLLDKINDENSIFKIKKELLPLLDIDTLNLFKKNDKNIL